MKKILIAALALCLLAPGTLAQEVRIAREIAPNLTIDAEVADPETAALPVLECTYIDYAAQDPGRFTFLPAGFPDGKRENERGIFWIPDGREDLSVILGNEGWFTCIHPEGHWVYSAILYAPQAELPQDRDLRFMDRSQAENAAAAFLRSLGIQESAVTSLSAISKETYDALYEMSREDHEEELEYGKLGATQWYDWPTQDVCYVVECTAAYQGVPFLWDDALGSSMSGSIDPNFQEPFTNNKQYWPGITLYLFEQGVKYLDVRNAFSCRPDGEAAQILSRDEAVEAFAQTGPRPQTSQMHTVTQIGLYYVMCPADGRMMARPYWLFTIERQQKAPLAPAKSYFFLNAHTGQWEGEW